MIITLKQVHILGMTNNKIDYMYYTYTSSGFHLGFSLRRDATVIELGGEDYSTE